MKNVLFLISLFFALHSFGQDTATSGRIVAPPPPTTQEAPAKTVIPVVVNVKEKISTPELINVNKTNPLIFVVDGDSIYFDIATPVNTITEFVKLLKEQQGGLPTNLTGWIVLLLGIFASGRINIFITGVTKTIENAKGLWRALKTKPNRTSSIVSLVVGFGIAFFNAGFNFKNWDNTEWTLLGMVSGLVFMVATNWYEETKKEETPPAPTLN